jgi:pimeloyl-ACP methyl ester carboxylesterase
MLHYQRLGTGKPLVFVHGFLSSGTCWLAQLGYFSRFFDVLAIDLPGFGASQTDPLQDSVDGFSTATVRFLDALGIHRFSLVGHSMGGMVAQQLALDHADRIDRLVLYGTAASGVLPQRFESFDESITRFSSLGVESAGESVIQSWLIQREASPAYALCRQAAAGLTTDAAVRALRGIAKWDVRQRLGELTCPTLIITGDRDRSTSPDEAFFLRKNIKRSELCIAPSCAHAAHLDSADLFTSVVGEFLLRDVGSLT